MDPRTQRASKPGLILFFIYLALYGGFVGTAAFAGPVLARPVLWGVNLAIVWGFALIVAPLVLALLYLRAAHHPTDNTPTP